MSDRIHDLWPTLLGKAAVSGHAEHTGVLLARALGGTGPDSDGAQPPLTPNPLAPDIEAGRWLRGRIDAAVCAYLCETGSGHPCGYGLEAWFEVLEIGAYRELENDSEAFLSGAYFLNTPAESMLEHTRSDCAPSRLILFDPRTGFNALSIEGDPYFAPNVVVSPEAGTMMLWPGFTRHFLSVHLADQPWALVRFRVILDASLPAEAMSPPDSPDAPLLEFSKAFSTRLVERRLPDWKSPNAGLAKLIEADDARHRDRTARYKEQDFFSRAGRDVQWLLEQINETVISYLRHVGVGLEVEWVIEGWYNVNRYGDQHPPHSHQGAYLSGTYYVAVPAGEETGARSHPASISFYDPRTSAHAVPGGEQSGTACAHRVHPSPGTLMMWPSTLMHYVHPNLSDARRVSISFNVILLKVGGRRPG